MNRRFARTAIGLSAAAVVGLSGCTTTKQPGQKYSALGTGMTILLFVVVPLAIFGVIALLSAMPSMLRRPRYRPGKGWDHDPLWFAGPDNPQDAIKTARPRPTGKGGASAEW